MAVLIIGVVAGSKPSLAETKMMIKSLMELYREELKSEIAMGTGEQILEQMTKQFKSDDAIMRWINEVRTESDAGLYDDAVDVIKEVMAKLIDKTTDEELMNAFKSSFKDSRSYRMIELMFKIETFASQ